jgi:DNA polymerase III sliding clamp (beta) subunit (PCNA family)
MKCRRDLWTKALDLAKHAVDSKSTIPELSRVVVEACSGRAIIRGTDLQRRMRIQFPCSDGDLGFQSFDLRTLVQISKAAKKTKGEEIEIRQTDSGLQLLIGGRTFEIDHEGTGENRPEDREGTGSDIIRSWDAKEFLRALDYVLPAMSRDETRFHLCSVAMVDDKLVTTDGHRLHLSDGVESFGEREVLIDGGTAIALKDSIKLTDADYVRARHWNGGDGTLEFSIEGPRIDALIVSKGVGAAFPPYKNIVPGNQSHYKVDPGPFRDSLQTALKLIKAKGRDPSITGVEMHANGDLRVTTDIGFREVIELSQTADPECHLGANPAYLIDALRGATGTCQVEYGEVLDPIGIRTGETFYAVVMPMRID